jgi:TPR repeat protein
MELPSSSSDCLRAKREAPSVHVEEEEEMQAEHADKKVMMEKSPALTLQEEALSSIRLQHWFINCMRGFAAAKGNVGLIIYARDKLLAIARRGHPRAGAICGNSLYCECGWPPFPPDMPLGEKLLQQSRDAGDVAGKFWCAFHGIGEAMDRRKAFAIIDEFHHDNPNHNDGYVLFLLGWCHYLGYTNTINNIDYQSAFSLFQQSADLGNPLSILRLGDFYCDGTGVARDYKQAIEWWLKATEYGNSEAMIRVALSYKFVSFEMKCDAQKAIEWFQIAAALGSSFAVRVLALG